MSDEEFQWNLRYSLKYFERKNLKLKILEDFPRNWSRNTQ